MCVWMCFPYALCLYLTCTCVHTHIFDLTLSLPSLGCCIFSFLFSSSLTFLSSVGVSACLPPLSLSLSPSLALMGRTLSTLLSCADLYDSSIRFLCTLSLSLKNMLSMSSVSSSVWDSGSEWALWLDHFLPDSQPIRRRIWLADWLLVGWIGGTDRIMPRWRSFRLPKRTRPVSTHASDAFLNIRLDWLENELCVSGSF